MSLLSVIGDAFANGHLSTANSTSLYLLPSFCLPSILTNPPQVGSPFARRSLNLSTALQHRRAATTQRVECQTLKRGSARPTTTTCFRSLLPTTIERIGLPQQISHWHCFDDRIYTVIAGLHAGLQGPNFESRRPEKRCQGTTFCDPESPFLVFCGLRIPAEYSLTLL